MWLFHACFCPVYKQPYANVSSMKVIYCPLAYFHCATICPAVIKKLPLKILHFQNLYYTDMLICVRYYLLK